MVSAAIIGTALGGGVPGPSASLFLASADVLRRVPLDTISVTENGPGGVSSMSFTIEDPLSVITVNRGDEVLYFDHIEGTPDFRGWVQGWTASVFGLGRAYQVECIGVEAVLDWQMVPSLTIPVGTHLATAAQMIVAAATPIGVALRAFSSGFNSTQAFPTSGQIPPGPTTVVTNEVVTLAGETVREALRKVFDVGILNGGSAPNDLISQYARTVGLMVTVDYWFGLRMSIGQPADYATLTVIDTPAGTFNAANLQHAIDAGGPRAVYVRGASGAASGLITDGTGIPGLVAFIDDSTITTAQQRDTAGLAYLNDNAIPERGEFDVETFIPSTNIRAGSQLVITDAQVGLSAVQYRIASITKRFHGGRKETWTINYGGFAPSLAKAIRRLTRAVRN